MGGSVAVRLCVHRIADSLVGLNKRLEEHYLVATLVMLCYLLALCRPLTKPGKSSLSHRSPKLTCKHP